MPQLSPMPEIGAMNQRDLWNQIGPIYQERQQISTASVFYGPLSPDECELQLLGEVTDLRILDFGCGGGQSAIALARQGAAVTAVDFSAAQLDFARPLAVNEGFGVQFMEGDEGILEQLSTNAWDMIFSSQTFQYIADMERLLRACRRLLKRRGRLVFSVDHPFRDSFLDMDEGELSVYPTRSYFDQKPMTWPFAASAHRITSHHRTLEQWFTLLHESGFQVQRLVEPLPPDEILDALWPADGPLSPLRDIPHTLIISATPTTG